MNKYHSVENTEEFMPLFPYIAADETEIYKVLI